MSNANDPLLRRVASLSDGSLSLLLIVMGLPLIDGVFVTIILSGMLETIGGMILVGVLIFGGSATVAVVFAEMNDSAREYIPTVVGFGIVLILAAILQAVFAPTIAGLIDLVIFERFAAILLLMIAAHTASANVSQYLPRPVIIVAIAVLVSVDPSNASLVVDIDAALMLRAGLTAAIGVAFVVLVMYLAPLSRDKIDPERVQFGSALALGILPFVVLGLVNVYVPFMVLVLTGMFSLRFNTILTDESSTTTRAPNPAEMSDHSQPEDDSTHLPPRTTEQDYSAPWL